VPNTQKCTVWALRTFTDWYDERTKCTDIQAKMSPWFARNPDAEKLNCLSHFIVEAGHKDGEPYVPYMDHSYPSS